MLDSGRHPWLTWPDVSSVLPDLKVLYAAEPDRLFWFGGDFAYPALPEALETVTSCDSMGLRPADYDGVALAQRWAAIKASASPSLTERALLDVAVTVSSMRLLQSAHRGRVDPRNVGFDYDVTSKRIDLATALRAARDGKGFPAAVAAAEPQFPVYHRLVNALADYRTLASHEPAPLPALSKGQRKVEPGKPWVGVTALDARLRHFRDLPADTPAPSTAADGTPLYDANLVSAVKRFQGRHALEADGVIGPGTIVAMNVPVAHRVRQLELALERERWLPEMLKEELIFVNVPLFRLWAYDPDRPDEPVKMNVVAGKALGHATPIFIDEMEYVTFRPYWNPPI
ncbi:MAG TPA: peptidoglycan-binding protein, partial [Vicinamibacteria bacterium]|nr:peptidoglycan-binding protein [Vicinamibacteria bacterium]